ncbi:hypothetical protein DYB32_009041 [Aphanomyces invadans]|uniref:Uncharacterized protein n=1 Tax=Aphanomyces invadans TaxID=157072 RepID=A0A3R6WFV6_9STRA|nr:hypothetical protein DYB32_009041 [Aphanomyces invadans]
MSPHASSAPICNGPPLDDKNRTFLEWKPLFISQANGHEFTPFYTTKSYVPTDLDRSILSILDDDVQVDKLKHPELYAVDPDLLGNDHDARHKEIEAYIHSVKSATLKAETAKALTRLRSLALTFLNSSMVDSLRKLFSNITCPFTLYESIVSRFENNPLISDPAVLNAQSQKIKYRKGDCLDTLFADVKSIASQYRSAMIPTILDTPAVDYDAFLWTNHYMVKLSEVFSDDKQIWDLIRAISSNAKASGQPCSVASIDAAIKDALATHHLRLLALGEHGSADSASTRSHLINAAVGEPVHPSLGLVARRSLPSYAHVKCHDHIGPACFYCGDSEHVLTTCKVLLSDYSRNARREGFPQTIFEKHGKKLRRLSSRKIRHDHPLHDRRDRDDSDDRGGDGSGAGHSRGHNPPTKRDAPRSRSRDRGGDNRTRNWSDEGYGGRSRKVRSNDAPASNRRMRSVSVGTDRGGRSGRDIRLVSVTFDLSPP